MQPTNQPLKRRKYDSIFKADVLKMIANGQSVAYLAQALGFSEALIYNRDGVPLETTEQKGRKTTPFGTGFRYHTRKLAVVTAS